MATKVKEKAATAAAQNGFSLISNEKLKQMYTTMLKCRALEEHIRLILKQGKFPGNHHSTLGQEATRVGVAIDLGPGDTIVSSHWDVTTSFIEGVPLGTILSYLLGQSVNPDERRPSLQVNGNASSLNGVAPPAASSRLWKSATDAALANQKRNRSDIIVAFSGERSTSLNSWEKALEFAGRHHLPMLLVAQHNLPTEPANTKSQRNGLGTDAYGFPSIPVDGNDVVAVYRVAFEAITRARQGGGPTLIRCDTFFSHGDPLNLMEDYLTRKGLFTSEWKQKILGDFQVDLHER